MDMIKRRKFLKLGLKTGAGALFLPALPGLLPSLFAANASEAGDEHYFVLYTLRAPSSVDHSYLFDARPLEMTKNGLIQNYLGREPRLWTGDNGGATFATELTDELRPLRSYFSIVNGVTMATDFDGHDQNQRYLHSGDALGGESFLAQLRGQTHVLDSSGIVFDTHDAASAAAQPASYARLATRIAETIEELRTASYDDRRSVLDVTTFLFSAEFGRSMRQPGRPIDATGTDHNTLANMLLIGGKGIRGGQVIGATDFQSSHEVLSGAHLEKDPRRLRVMGRPFDFGTCRPRNDLPAIYQASDYLGFNSVINTIFSSFGVPSENWRPNSPVIQTLLS